MVQLFSKYLRLDHFPQVLRLCENLIMFLCQPGSVCGQCDSGSYVNPHLVVAPAVCLSWHTILWGSALPKQGCTKNHGCCRAQSLRILIGICILETRKGRKKMKCYSLRPIYNLYKNRYRVLELIMIRFLLVMN